MKMAARKIAITQIQFLWFYVAPHQHPMDSDFKLRLRHVDDFDNKWFVIASYFKMINDASEKWRIIYLPTDNAKSWFT